MRSVFFTEKGKVIIDTKKDELIYEAPMENENGRWITSGTDLYVHKTKKGDTVFYAYHWSRYEGVPDSVDLITKDEAIGYMARQTQRGGVYMPAESEIKAFLEYVPDFLDEDA